MGKPIFIDLEGLNGVGKSTIAPMLADYLNAEFIVNVPKEFSELRRYLDRKQSIDARYAFFISATLYTSGIIREILETGKDVVLESYIYRVIAFHQGMGSMLKFSLPESFVYPSHPFLLYCSEQERQKRMITRGNFRQQEKKYWDVLVENNLQCIFDEYSKFSLIRLDTTDLSPEESVIKIANIVKGSSKPGIVNCL